MDIHVPQVVNSFAPKPNVNSRYRPIYPPVLPVRHYLKADSVRFSGKTGASDSSDEQHQDKKKKNEAVEKVVGASALGLGLGGVVAGGALFFLGGPFIMIGAAAMTAGAITAEVGHNILGSNNSSDDSVPYMS